MGDERADLGFYSDATALVGEPAPDFEPDTFLGVAGVVANARLDGRGQRASAGAERAPGVDHQAQARDVGLRGEQPLGSVRRRPKPQHVGAHGAIECVACLGAEHLPPQARCRHRHVDVRLERFARGVVDGHVAGAVAADGPDVDGVGDAELRVRVDARERALDGAAVARSVRRARAVVDELERPVALRGRECDAGGPCVGADVGAEQPRGDVSGQRDSVSLAFERACREAPPGAPRGASGLVHGSLEPEAAVQHELVRAHHLVGLEGLRAFQRIDELRILDRCLGPRGSVMLERAPGDPDFGVGTAIREPLGDSVDDVACDGAPEPGDPGFLERIGVLDGAGGGAVGDPCVRRVRQCHRHRLAAVVDGVVEQRDVDRLRRVARVERERPGRCRVVVPGRRRPVGRRVVDGDGERRDPVEAHHEVEPAVAVLVGGGVGDRQCRGSADGGARAIRELSPVGRAHGVARAAGAVARQRDVHVVPPAGFDGDGPALVAALDLAFRLLHRAAGDGEGVVVAKRPVADLRVLAEAEVERESVCFAAPAVLGRDVGEACGERVLVPGRCVLAVPDGAGAEAGSVVHRRAARLGEVEQEGLAVVFDGVVDDLHRDRLGAVSGLELKRSGDWPEVAAHVAVGVHHRARRGARDGAEVHDDQLGRRRCERHGEHHRSCALFFRDVVNGDDGQRVVAGRVGAHRDIGREGVDPDRQDAPSGCRLGQGHAERRVAAVLLVADPGHVAGVDPVRERERDGAPVQLERAGSGAVRVGVVVGVAPVVGAVRLDGRGFRRSDCLEQAEEHRWPERPLALFEEWIIAGVRFGEVAAERQHDGAPVDGRALQRWDVGRAVHTVEVRPVVVVEDRDRVDRVWGGGHALSVDVGEDVELLAAFGDVVVTSGDGEFVAGGLSTQGCNPHRLASSQVHGAGMTGEGFAESRVGSALACHVDVGVVKGGRCASGAGEDQFYASCRIGCSAGRDDRDCGLLALVDAGLADRYAVLAWGCHDACGRSAAGAVGTAHLEGVRGVVREPRHGVARRTGVAAGDRVEAPEAPDCRGYLQLVAGEFGRRVRRRAPPFERYLCVARGRGQGLWRRRCGVVVEDGQRHRCGGARLVQGVVGRDREHDLAWILGRCVVQRWQRRIEFCVPGCKRKGDLRSRGVVVGRIELLRCTGYGGDVHVSALCVAPVQRCADAAGFAFRDRFFQQADRECRRSLVVPERDVFPPHFRSQVGPRQLGGLRRVVESVVDRADGDRGARHAGRNRQLALGAGAGEEPARCVGAADVRAVPLERDVHGRGRPVPRVGDGCRHGDGVAVLDDDGVAVGVRRVRGDREGPLQLDGQDGLACERFRLVADRVLDGVGAGRGIAERVGLRRVGRGRRRERHRSVRDRDCGHCRVGSAARVDGEPPGGGRHGVLVEGLVEDHAHRGAGEPRPFDRGADCVDPMGGVARDLAMGDHGVDRGSFRLDLRASDQRQRVGGNCQSVLLLVAFLDCGHAPHRDGVVLRLALRLYRSLLAVQHDFDRSGSRLDVDRRAEREGDGDFVPDPVSVVGPRVRAERHVGDGRDGVVVLVGERHGAPHRRVRRERPVARDEWCVELRPVAVVVVGGERQACARCVRGDGDVDRVRRSGQQLARRRGAGGSAQRRPVPPQADGLLAVERHPVSDRRRRRRSGTPFHHLDVAVLVGLVPGHGERPFGLRQERHLLALDGH